MNSEAMLFNHEGFGEAFIGVARHAGDMSQLDRMIFEDCVFSGDGLGCGKVLAPHFNIKQDCRYHLRPESIQRRIEQAGAECSFHQATTLCDAWTIIEATEKMVKTFICWIAAKGTNKAVEYFENLAMNLAEVEVLEEQSEIIDYGIDTEMEPPEMSDAPTDIIHYHPIGCEIVSGALCPKCHAVYDLNDHDWKDAEEDTVWCDCCDTSFTAYKYEPVTTWESRQSVSYRKLLACVRTIINLDELKAIGKKVFEEGSLNHEQSGVFWYEYKQSKERIMKVVKSNLGSSARTLLNQINSRKSKELSAYGFLLYKLQSGQISMTDPPSENEWTIIWKAYQARKKL